MNTGTTTTADATPDEEPLLLEAMPDSITEWEARRARWVLDQPQTNDGLEWVVNDLQHWEPGATIRVAFLGGSTELHAAIADALKPVHEACNLTLDLGLDAATGKYRTWSEQDQDFVAEIRVSFDQKGYFSLVGMDSVNVDVGRPIDKVGGRPFQRSLNLGGYDVQRPFRWRGTVVHEFLHAIGFHHEHQNLTGPCQEDFRWDDDPGYTRTTDARGSYTVDAAGLRPGIYTYLSGPPNGWERPKVDHNLRPATQQGVVYGPFDRASVMLYRFPALFYKTPNSTCAPAGDGDGLSAGDIEGLKRLYPVGSQAILELVKRSTSLRSSLDGGLEGINSPFTARAQELLDARLRRLAGRAG
jgi:hypothetical protein